MLDAAHIRTKANRITHPERGGNGESHEDGESIVAGAGYRLRGGRLRRIDAIRGPFAPKGSPIDEPVARNHQSGSIFDFPRESL
jgi:hypothetical protein